MASATDFAETRHLSSIIFDPQSIAAILLCFTLLAWIHDRLTRPRLPLPPGPPGNPIFGNSLPKAFIYRHFETWTREYGPVFSIRQGLTTIVVVGRLQAAQEIMEREGAALADRPRNISAGETLSGGMRVLLTPVGERFKKMRRALHTHLQPRLVNNYAPVFQKNARRLILDIVQDPSRHQDHAKRYSAAVVMALTYGKDIKSFEDPEVQAVNRCLTRLGNNLRPGLWKVDAYPFLRYVPGYLAELQAGHDEELNLFKTQLSVVRTQLVTQPVDTIPQSFGRYLIERQKELELTDDETAYLAGSMFGAGSDTTASAISVSVLAAAQYPDHQQRVWEELDSVLGTRPPKMEDQEMLPMTMAWVLETFRWRPVTAGGVAHKATKDIIWNGYLIPKGASVIGNVWSVGRDPVYFPDPDAFNPMRWIDKEGDGGIRDDLKSYAFGFGRRVCPGSHLATASVFLNTALLLWAFKINADPTAPIDEYAFTESANAHPEPFKVEFQPRFGSSRDAGLQSIKDALENYGEI